MQTEFRLQIKKLVYLALPIMAGGMINSVMPFINVIYLAHLGEEALAAGGLALSIFIFTMVLFWGLFSTMTALIARYQGAGEQAKIGLLVRTALVFALFTSIPVIVIFKLAALVLGLLNFSADFVHLVEQFFNTLSFAVPADLLLTALYSLCFGLSKPRYVLGVTLCQVPVNLFLNYAFMFGHFGLPQFGIAGIGVGVACTYWLMLIGLLAVLLRLQLFRDYLCHSKVMSWAALKELIQVGGPAGLQWVLEMGFFAVVSLMMGQLSIAALAAYQVVFQIYNLFFSFVYNFNQAVTVRVAEGVGARSVNQVKFSYFGAYFFIGFILCILILLIAFAREPLIALFRPAGLAVTASFFTFCHAFLIIMPLFALSDFLGYTHFEVLRAFKDTRVPMLIALVVYWILAIPLMAAAIHFRFLAHPVDLWYFMIGASVLSLAGQGWRYRRQYLRFQYSLETP